MNITLIAVEPQARPTVASLTLKAGDPFAVYLLGDLAEQTRAGLRATVLRREGEAAPPGAVFLFEATGQSPRGADPGGVLVQRLARDVPVELEQPGGTSRVSQGTRLPSGSRVSALLHEQSAVSFSLEIASRVVQGAQATVGRSSLRRSWAIASAANAFWLIPSVMSTLAAPKARVMGVLLRVARRLGIPPALVIPIVAGLVGLLGLAFVAWRQHGAAVDATARAEAAESRAATAELSRNSALTAESACLGDRASLASTVGKEQEALRTAAEKALALPLAQSVARDLGGEAMKADALWRLDEASEGPLRDRAVATLIALGDSPTAGADRCLEQAEAPGLDLPAYVLFWHPNAERLCPEGYREVTGGVEWVGPWGLSARVAKRFGPPPPDEELTDPRLGERWSAVALTSGLRAVQRAILSAEVGGRAPVLPGQVHLWSLALFDALNRMPARAGEAEGGLDTCVTELMQGLASASGSAEPGQPVLPDIGAIADGAQISVPPTLACPWPADALSVGAKAALRAAARQTGHERIRAESKK